MPPTTLNSEEPLIPPASALRAVRLSHEADRRTHTLLPILTHGPVSASSAHGDNALLLHLVQLKTTHQRRINAIHPDKRCARMEQWTCRGLSEGLRRNLHHRKTSTPTQRRHARHHTPHLHPRMLRVHKCKYRK